MVSHSRATMSLLNPSAPSLSRDRVSLRCRGLVQVIHCYRDTVSITVRITILSPFYLSVAAGDVPRIEVSRLCVVLAHRGAIDANGATDRTLIHAVHLCNRVI